MTRVLIIGAGPAGLGAAEVLAKAGAEVTLVERQSHAGGIPRLCGHSPFGLREFHRLMGGEAYARRLVQAATKAGARILLNHSAVSFGRVVQLATPQGDVTMAPDRILLATGAREASRAERLLPGERPLGIITTGALQDLWFARRALPFRRPVILGSELVAMSAILTCRQAGATPLAVVEPAAQPVARAPFRWLPRALGIPFLTGTTIADIIAKEGRLTQLVLRDRFGQTSVQECDGLVLTGDFRPESGLARMCGLAIDPATLGPIVDQSGRTTRPEVYAAGNLLRGIETAGQCWAEGRAVARAMLDDLAPTPSLEVRPGPGLRYVMPQRLTPGAQAALPALQIRLVSRARGTLTLTDGAGRRVASLQTASAPERRVTLPLSGLALQDAKGPLIVAMEED
jgi:NADPH-dependent 2,4-dienoyl-CoA reductase/sulfur reductase-like enzyme